MEYPFLIVQPLRPTATFLETAVNDNTPKFWLGNALLGISLVMLIFLGGLWQALGAWAMVLWMGLAGMGIYLITQDKGPSSNLPD